MNVYIASSWKNLLYPGIVHIIKRMGHDVYDFRHPAPGNDGFRWQDVDADWKPGDTVSPERWRNMLAHPIAKQGYAFDSTALKNCDVCVLVLPAGRSACFEFGYAIGQGKRGIVVAFDNEQPDLMFMEATICGTPNELFDAFNFNG